MRAEGGFIGSVLALLTGKDRQSTPKNNTILDNLVLGAVEIGALVIGFRAVKSLTDNDTMGVIGSLVFATTAVETVCEIADRFQWIPREIESAFSSPVPAPLALPAPAPVLISPPAMSAPPPLHMIFNRQ